MSIFLSFIFCFSFCNKATILLDLKICLYLKKNLFLDSLVSCRTEEKKGSSGFDDRVLSTFLIEMDGISNDVEVCCIKLSSKIGL